jgi:hypothetical protein
MSVLIPRPECPGQDSTGNRVLAYFTISGLI